MEGAQLAKTVFIGALMKYEMKQFHEIISKQSLAFLSLPVWHFPFLFCFFSVVSSIESLRNLLYLFVRGKFRCFPYKVKLRYMS